MRSPRAVCPIWSDHPARGGSCLWRRAAPSVMRLHCRFSSLPNWAGIGLVALALPVLSANHRPSGIDGRAVALPSCGSGQTAAVHSLAGLSMRHRAHPAMSAALVLALSHARVLKRGGSFDEVFICSSTLVQAATSPTALDSPAGQGMAHALEHCLSCLPHGDGAAPVSNASVFHFHVLGAYGLTMSRKAPLLRTRIAFKPSPRGPPLLS
jgi:hypothetical protein